jgi:hypothetical protein
VSAMASGRMPHEGERSPGFMDQPSRCSAMVYDRKLQSTVCREAPSRRVGGSLHGAIGGGVWACGRVPIISMG